MKVEVNDSDVGDINMSSDSTRGTITVNGKTYYGTDLRVDSSGVWVDGKKQTDIKHSVHADAAETDN